MDPTIRHLNPSSWLSLPKVILTTADPIKEEDPNQGSGAQETPLEELTVIEKAHPSATPRLEGVVMSPLPSPIVATPTTTISDQDVPEDPISAPNDMVECLKLAHSDRCNQEISTSLEKAEAASSDNEKIPLGVPKMKEESNEGPEAALEFPFSALQSVACNSLPSSNSTIPSSPRLTINAPPPQAMLPSPITSSSSEAHQEGQTNKVNQKVMSRASFRNESDFKDAGVQKQDLTVSKPRSKFSEATMQQLRNLQEILKQKNYYLIKGPLIEAIQLYVEELHAECENDIKHSERYLPAQVREQCEKQRKLGLHPFEEISLCIKMVRCKVGSYLERRFSDEIFKDLQGSKTFHNPIYLLRALIQHQPNEKAAFKKVIEARIARLSKLVQVLELVDELRRTESGMDVLSEPHESEICLKNSDQLIQTVEKWYAILIKDLKADYTHWILGNAGIKTHKKKVQDFCSNLQKDLQASEREFKDWQSKGGTWEELVTIKNGVSHCTSSIQQLDKNDPLRIAFSGHLAIGNSATSLMQAQHQIIAAKRFDPGVCWLAYEGLSDLDNALEGVLRLGELSTILTDLPTFKADPNSSSGPLSDAVAEIESVSQILMQHWHKNSEAIHARQSIKSMQQKSTAATTSDVMKFSTTLKNLTDHIIEDKIIYPLISKVSNVVDSIQNRTLAEVEDSINSKLLSLKKSVFIFVFEALRELVRVGIALQSGPDFRLPVGLVDSPPVSPKFPEQSMEAKQLPPPKKTVPKSLKKKHPPAISRSPKQAMPIQKLEERPSLPLEQTTIEVSEKSEKRESPEEPSLPLLQEVRPLIQAVDFPSFRQCVESVSEKRESPEEPSLPVLQEVRPLIQAVDIPSFRQCVESVTGIQSAERSTSRASEHHPKPPSNDHLTSEKVKMIDKIMSYCERNKYSTEARKERNVIAILRQNGYKPLPRPGGSHQRWKHPALPRHNPILLSTKSGGDLVHRRTMKEIEEQLQDLAGVS